jgi:radical SAM protein with 4Fe4S-binding SPASM domain
MEEAGVRLQKMSFNTCKKAIDDLTEFPHPLKALIFAGHGEPLTHPELPSMVTYAKEKNVAERIEIVTNASLLTPALSDALIQAGVDRMRISLQGLNARKYKEVAKVDIDFEAFLENIAYFYNVKKHTEVHIKIIDVALEEDEKEFYHLFSPMSDQTTIEHMVPLVQDVNYSKLGKEFSFSKEGHRVQNFQVCAQPCYMLVLEPSGRIVPCCSTKVPCVLGDVNKQSLKEIWNTAGRRKFLALQLKDRTCNATCASCEIPAYGLQPGDYLDDHIHELLPFYKEL